MHTPSDEVGIHPTWLITRFLLTFDVGNPIANLSISFFEWPPDSVGAGSKTLALALIAI